MKLKFIITGMTCAACSARVEKVTKAVPGVNSCEVNLLGGTMTVDADNENVSGAILRAVTDAGYGAAPAGEKKQEKAPAEKVEAQPKAEGEAKKANHRRRPHYRRSNKPKQNTEG